MFEMIEDPRVKRNQDFHDACRNGDKDKAIRLLEEDPNDHYLIDITRSDFPAVLYAAHNQHWELCKELIERGVDINVKNKHGWSPLHVFASHGHEELIRMSIEIGAAYVNRKDSAGKSALYEAVTAEREGAVDVLISLGAEVNALTKSKDSPLHMAARKGNLSLVRKLAALGGHAHGENDMGETPISLCGDGDMRSELERAALSQTVKEAEATRAAEAAANGEAPPTVDKPKRRILKA